MACEPPNDAAVLQAFHTATKLPRMQPSLTHRCTTACRMWEMRHTNMFVCRTSRNVHRCGEACQHRTSTVSDEICMLTGFVLRGVACQYQPVYSKSCRPMLQSHMQRTVPTSTRVLVTGRVRRWVARAIDDLLCSPRRAELVRVHKQRALLATRRASRANGSFCTVIAAAALACIRAGATLNPTADPAAPEVAVLKQRMCTYVLAFPALRHTERQIVAFVAACVQRLATGMTVAGVELFFRSPFVAAHAPSEIAHSALCGVPCRQVSAAHRLIVTTALGTSGIPSPSVVF